MKIIDLLKDIAEGKPVPKKIKYHNNIFIYDEKCKFYKLEGQPNVLNFHIGNLNDEVEIIEDTPKKIEKIKLSSKYTRNQKKIIYKINEIIDKLNKE